MYVHKSKWQIRLRDLVEARRGIEKNDFFFYSNRLLFVSWCVIAQTFLLFPVQNYENLRQKQNVRTMLLDYTGSLLQIFEEINSGNGLRVFQTYFARKNCRQMVVSAQVQCILKCSSVNGGLAVLLKLTFFPVLWIFYF